MNSISEILSPDELDRLNDFLLNRVPEDDEYEGKDEGVIGVSMLDGFFTAIISNQHPIMPS